MSCSFSAIGLNGAENASRAEHSQNNGCRRTVACSEPAPAIRYKRVGSAVPTYGAVVWVIAVDRFAREILAFLKPFCAARSRQLNAKPFGGSSSLPYPHYLCNNPTDGGAMSDTCEKVPFVWNEPPSFSFLYGREPLHGLVVIFRVVRSSASSWPAYVALAITCLCASSTILDNARRVSPNTACSTTGSVRARL
jgi:hypothetical protein